ncbi:hypothetical protein BJY52DRAFT_1225536 [Lactarius psammicola]|nr:hypothetical protein BJY52DRAFT_1225536 [Lactarius psammicola]
MFCHGAMGYGTLVLWGIGQYEKTARVTSSSFIRSERQYLVTPHMMWSRHGTLSMGGSAISGWGGGGRSSIAAPSMPGMGLKMNANLGANPFGMPPRAWLTRGYGSAARSMYAGSVYVASEIGAPRGGAAMGSTTNSVHGDWFGTPPVACFPAGNSAATRESGGGAPGWVKREASDEDRAVK